MGPLRRFARSIALSVMAAFALTSIAIPAARAAAISTQAMVQQSDTARQRSHINELLQRHDVRDQLVAMGVDPAQVQSRVDSLTDAQVNNLSQRIDTLPAGGDGIIGALVFIFVVLLITDILGYTDIFPFVKKTAR